MKRRAYLTALLTALAGCAASEDSNVAGQELGVVGSESLLRFIDREAGVVVYVTDGGYSGGVAVVPIEDTDLE